MRIGPLLVIAAVMVGGACTNEAQSSDTTAVAKTVEVATDAGGNPIDFGRLCVHTDPGKLPISVHRALGCPDGTSVSVRGIIVGAAGGAVLLCDTGAGGDNCLTIDGGVLPVDGDGSPGAAIDYTGTVSKGVLTVTSPAVVPDVGAGPPLIPLNRPLSPLRSG
jgi:hypothetical protein